MPWSGEFRDELRAATKSPQFILETIELPAGIAGSWRVSSSHRFGRAYIASGATCTGGEVRPLTWDTTWGSFSVPIVGDPSWLMKVCSRGQIVQLLVGFAGWEEDRFQRVAVGAVQNVAGKGKNWTITCKDLQGMLVSRIATSNPQLFSGDGAGTGTYIKTTSYVANNATIVVNSTTGFVKEDDGGGAMKGLLRVRDATGAVFYVTYTGMTATSFTGCSHGVVGTTAVDVATGTGSATNPNVFSCPYLADHPIDATRRLLLSTGAYTSAGTYNTLPTSWAYGLPTDMVDGDDMTRYRDATQPASGSDDWTFWYDDGGVNDATTGSAGCLPSSDGWSWLVSRLGKAGYFVTMRQGAVTCRAIVDPETCNVTVQARLTDADILEIEDHEMWCSDWQLEYRSFLVRSHDTGGLPSADETGGTARAVGGLPAMAEYVADLSAAVYNNNASAIRTEIYNRLDPWYTRIPERLGLRLRIRHAALAPGDLVEITSSRLTGRLETTRGGYVARRALVIGVSPRWWGGGCSAKFLVLPTWAEAVHG